MLNENHRRALLAGLKYIDRLLAEGSAGLSPAEDGAVFRAAAPDATPVQRKVISDQVARLRRALRAALDACSIPVPPPEIGGLWNLRSYLVSADIALEEIGPDHLRGYGPISAAAADGIRALQAQIRAALAELQLYVASGSGGDLGARLRRLDRTRDEIRLLAELERIVTAHGLVELRPALSLLLERAESNVWTVAFVGRVSSGKSSLLNYLLGTDLLPSGVTPVTAVPVRVVRGPEAVATVSFAQEGPRRVPATELGSFASEQGNPGNRRHVTDILLELPSERLAGGVHLVDTPGLGSFATAGAEQTRAFLPRCDLGVLLVDCAGALGEEDVAVARSMLEGGAEVLLVLSKADLLAAADLEQVAAYVGRQLGSALSREIPVSPVSVAPGSRALTEKWWAEVLAPRQAEHRRLAAEALRRKIGALKEAAVAALALRARAPSPPSAPAGVPPAGVARAALEKRRRGLYDLVLCARPRPEAVWREASILLSPGRPGGAAENPSKALAAILVRIAARLAEAAEAALEEARRDLSRALEEAGVDPASAALPAPSSQPLFDPSAVVAAAGLDSAGRRWPPGVFRFFLRRRLERRATAVLEESLRAHGSALAVWGQVYLSEIEGRFRAEMGLVEREPPDPGPAASPSSELNRDLALLRAWDAPAEAAS